MNNRISAYPEDGFTGAEKVWVKRASQHDAEAFAWLYKRSVNRIYRYIYYKIGIAAQAEDMTTQVFLKAWKSIGTFRWNHRPFEAWLFRIAHNLVVDYYRTTRETVPLDEFALADERADDLEDITQNHLDHEMLRKAIKHLTREQQQVINLKFFAGYSTNELARIMDKDPGAVRALQHRGLQALASTLRKSELGIGTRPHRMSKSAM